jgi:PhzF family phenazine biosynthesis protein
MRYPIYIVDAFTDKVFVGNPAAVCPLTSWLPDATMQQLAQENNLSETAFFVPQPDQSFQLRWFTPEVEIDLAGHPTQATAFVLFNELQFPGNTILFHTRSGLLTVTRKQDLLEMDFPSRMPFICEAPEALLKGFSILPIEILKSRDYCLVFPSQDDIENLVPDFKWLNQVETLGIIVTAPGKEVDFVSRFFVPNSVIGEDPVTGSAHATLFPFWAERLKKNELSAIQLSKRKGHLLGNFLGERVTIAGKAVLYAAGQFYL